MVTHDKLDKIRTRRLKIGIAVITLFLGILALTNPNEKKFEAWLESEYQIHVTYDVNEGRMFTRQTADGEEKLQFISSAARKLGILSYYDYLLKDDEGKVIQLKGTGILNRFVNK